MSTELYSVQQNSYSVGQYYILSTELHSVDRITFCPTEYDSVGQNSYSFGQNYILSTECKSVQQNRILLDKM